MLIALHFSLRLPVPSLAGLSTTSATTPRCCGPTRHWSAAATPGTSLVAGGRSYTPATTGRLATCSTSRCTRQERRAAGVLPAPPVPNTTGDCAVSGSRALGNTLVTEMVQRSGTVPAVTGAFSSHSNRIV